MKLLSCALWLTLPAAPAGQEADEWRRILKYEDGTVIELNTSRVTFGTAYSGRVRFRVVWAEPQSLKGLPETTYKTHLETVELKCRERRFRRAEITLLDADGKRVYFHEGESADAWEEVKPKRMMNVIIEPACALIEEKRRDPVAEP